MMAQQCTMCSSNASSGRCASCNCSAYCSKECQKADWPIHKLLCKQLQNFATPPNASSRRGIYLPVDKVNPEFVWVPTEWVPQNEDFDGAFERLKIKPYIGMDLGDRVRVWGNVIRSRERKDQIHLIMRDTANVDGSLPNRTIAGLTKGVAFHTWCGSMLAMKVATLQVDFDRYLHMDTVDFRDLVDLLRSYRSRVNISNMSLNRKHKGPQSPLENALKQKADGEGPSLANRFHQMNFDSTVTGVRINCSSDLSARENQMFEAVKVRRKDPIWNAPITSISNLVGMPVKVRRIKPASDTEEANQAATFLHLNADPQSGFWGWAYPWDWQRPAGSCLVVHAEKKELSPKDVEVLCSFCQDYLRPLFEESVKLKNSVLRQLTPSSYAQFCSDFESGRRTNDDETTVPGVRINCSSDLSARENQMFEAVKVPRKDPIWNAPITSISILIGMPVKVRRIKPASDTVEANQAATFLHLNADPQSEFWGFVYPWDWKRPAGSCLVVHAEKKKLSPKDVEVLCSFCQDYLRPLFEESVENSGNMKLKNTVLRHLTPSSYAQFCSDFESGRRTCEDETTIPGVRINCSSDLSARENQMFEAVKVPRKDPIWNAPITSISNLIGMPVKVRRIKPASDTVEANQAATFLHLNADPQSESWGWAYPWDWQDPAGSCLVVHAEKKELSPKDVEVLCSFCQDFLQPLFEESVENSGNIKLKNAVLRHLTPSSYAQFCSDFKSGRQTCEDETTE